MRSVLVSLALLAAVPAAHADRRISDDTAYTTPEGKLRAGLWKLQYGVNGVPGLELGTYTLPYATWALDVRSVNAHVKYQLLDRGPWTISAGLGVAYVDFANLDVPVDITIVPLTLLVAARLHDRFTLGLGMMYTQMLGEGEYNEDDDSAFRGAVAVSNVQTWLSLTTRISRGWSLYLETRGISSTEAAAAGDTTQMLDDRTRVEVALTGNASIDELQGASTLAALQWSGERFRLRFGVGYGNYNLPVINFVIPTATPFPELDLFWVF